MCLDRQKEGGTVKWSILSHYLYLALVGNGRPNTIQSN
jgi:hypothetical protein